jgi:hypothetical protein
MGLEAHEHYEALQSARQHQTTKEIQERYAARSGIEATHTQAVSRFRLRRCGYIGLAKTRLQHVIIAAAVNLVRIADWYRGIPAAQDALLTLRCPADGRLIRASNSPSVSMLSGPDSNNRRGKE